MGKKTEPSSPLGEFLTVRIFFGGGGRRERERGGGNCVSHVLCVGVTFFALKDDLIWLDWIGIQLNEGGR